MVIDQYQCISYLDLYRFISVLIIHCTITVFLFPPVRCVYPNVHGSARNGGTPGGEHEDGRHPVVPGPDPGRPVLRPGRTDQSYLGDHCEGK